MSYAHTVGDPTELVAALQAQVHAVKDAVDRAFDTPMDECLAALEAQDAAARARRADAPLEHRLTAAKTLVSAAYVYLDTIWMYLKASGVDPAAHPVHAKLAAVHAYFAKLNDAAPRDGKPRMAVDKGAAERMVKAAVTPHGTHTRFDDGAAAAGTKRAAPASPAAPAAPTADDAPKKVSKKKSKKKKTSA